MRGTSLVPSTVVKTLICVDDTVGHDMAGRIYNIYMSGPAGFSSVFECVSIMDNFFDEISFPQAYCENRTFSQKPSRKATKQPKKEVRQYMPENIYSNEHGQKATFMVQVQFRQNATWQGTITWMDEKRTQRFRSTLEMIKLMDNALSETAESGKAAPGTAWE